MVHEQSISISFCGVVVLKMLSLHEIYLNSNIFMMQWLEYLPNRWTDRHISSKDRPTDLGVLKAGISGSLDKDYMVILVYFFS